MKPKHQRLIFILVSVIFLCAGALFTLQAFRSNLIFFYSPSDMAERPLSHGEHVRIGGLVKPGSIQHGKDNTISFIITDKKHDFKIVYKGMLPNLFREGQGVIVEGYTNSSVTFQANKILAKHDETYMPKEVVDALKRSGNWHGDDSK